MSEPSVKGSLKFSRASVGGLVEMLDKQGSPTTALNVVDVLELLIDAGHFLRAADLAERTAEQVKGDGRERLFNGYVALCDLLEFGEQSKCLDALERLYIEIHNGGHSVPDKVRIGLLLARSLALCVSVGSLSQRAILRARSVLSVELDRLESLPDIELEGQVINELAKCYLHAPTEDARAALGLLEAFTRKEAFAGLSAARAFDIKRTIFQASQRIRTASPDPSAHEMLRSLAQSQGGVERAMVELTIARGQSEVDLERLECAADILKENAILSGAFEALYLLASHAFERGHNVVATRNWNEAYKLACASGFLHGRLLAQMGLFQSAMIGGDLKLALIPISIAARQLTSEMALGSSGLNVAAAFQILGDNKRSLEIAKRCEKFFKTQNLIGFQAQAAGIIGTCEARVNQWERARKAWSRAAELDMRRHAFVSACERQTLVVQAFMMHDLVKSGGLQPSTFKKMSGIISEVEASLAGFGELPEACGVRARFQTIRAHISVLGGDHIGGLRHMSKARELFASLGMDFDEAITEALTAISLLEVSKTTNPAVAEEAVPHLQRALQFFSSNDVKHIRWKIMYYLAVAGLVISQSKSAVQDRLKWRDLAAMWIRDAERLCDEDSQANEAGYGTIRGIVDIAPSLQPKDLDRIKKVLGLSNKPRKRRESGSDKVQLPEGLMH